MYRYCVDDAVTYDSGDLVLFRESPFAAWMERLTLENPDHGIAPDPGSKAPGREVRPQPELADSLRREGRNVTLIDWDAPEDQRRSATLRAMRAGSDFIVNGQLALGPMADSSNLLMRTSGYSQLGSYLYLPCDTEGRTTINSAFRLCFLADLLHSLQGQMPPQMLIIRGSDDLVSLKTEDHIYHYRAVKQRFMNYMREFRKHRMPDPSESAHFGRWSECANAVLRRRALRRDDPAALSAEDVKLPLVVAAAEAAPEVYYQNPTQARLATSRGIEVEGTLSDQAKALYREQGEVQVSTASPALKSLDYIGEGIGEFQGERHQPAAKPAPKPKPAPPAGGIEVDLIDDSDYLSPRRD